MPVPISDDLRWRAFRAFQRGEEAQVQVAAGLEVGEGSVKRLLRETGGVSPRPIPGSAPKVDDAGLVVLEQLLRK